MPPATASATATKSHNQNQAPNLHHLTVKTEPKPSPDALAPIRIDGSDQDVALSKSQYLTRPEVLARRARRVKQLARIYRDHYWALMEELKLKYREYYWEYGKSPLVEDDNNDNNNDDNENKINGGGGGDCPAAASAENGAAASSRCGVHGCKAKAMALTRFCHMHILSDSKQKLYKACNFSIKSSTTGPILCGKPILRSTVPSYCPLHFQKAEKHMARALKKSGLNVSSTTKVAPKFHVIVAEYVRQIQQNRRAAQRVNLENSEIKVENNS